MIVVKLESGGESVNLSLTGFLGGARFEAYRAACSEAGGRAVKRTTGWVNVVPLSGLGSLLARFSNDNLPVQVAPEVAAQLEAEADGAAAALTAGRSRLEVAQKRLAESKLSLYRFQETGVEWLAPRKRALLCDEMGLGKEQPVDANVLTPSGWREIGGLRVGDSVIGSDGAATRVTGIFPQGVKPSYRVWFSDGSSVEAGLAHLWTVRYRCGGRRWEALTLTTDQLRRLPKIRTLDLSKTALYLPMLSGPVMFNSSSQDLPIDPYLLGALIANGALSDGTPVLTVNTLDLNEIVEALPSGHVGAIRTYGSATHISIVRTVDKIRALDLAVLSRKKSIPLSYMLASVDARKALLHGLMDGDGSISKTSNKLVYHTISVDLSEAVRELVQGLGGIASIRTYDRSPEGKPVEYQVRMRLPKWVMPFTVSRKASRYKPGSHAQPCRTVASVEYVRDVESVCIAVEARDHLYVTEKCILTHNTVQALLSLPDRAAAVVVCPAGVRSSWFAELRRWRPDLIPGVIKSKSQARWPHRGQVLLASYGCLPADAGLLGMPPYAVTIIADEAHAAKNPKAERTKRLRAWAELCAENGGAIWLLTGTPLLNRPSELWALLQVAGLAHEAFGSWPQFVKLFNGAKGGWGGYEWGTPDPNAALRLQRVSLHRRRLDVLPDLPTKTRQDILVEDIDQETVKACDLALEALREAGIKLEDEVGTAAATKVSGAAFDLLSRARSALAASKVPALLDLVAEYEEAEEPLVVFSAHKSPIHAVAKRPGWRVITGETSAEERGVIVADFQAGKLKGVGGTIGAMGVGVTLTRGAHMIMVDKAWTPALNSQAEDRCCRIGQDRGVIIKNLVADHALDKRVAELLTIKQEIIEASISASAVEADHVAPSPAEELAKAAVRARETVEASNARAGEIARTEQASAREASLEVRARLLAAGVEMDDREIDVSGKFRGPANAMEDWAKEAMLTLAAYDPDHARTLNGQGFNKFDGEIGHSFADQLGRHGRLSDSQWRLAIRLATKYRRQVGGCPTQETA